MLDVERRLSNVPSPLEQNDNKLNTQNKISLNKNSNKGGLLFQNENHEDFLGK